MTAPVVADTSIWIDHFRFADPRIVALIDSDALVMHPFVVGELACGQLPRRSVTIRELQDLEPLAARADEEVLAFLDQHGLYGKGLGWIDVHLLCAAASTPGTALWTRDCRMLDAAESLGIAWAPPVH